MTLKNILANKTVLKVGVALASSILVLLLMMRGEHQNYSYELNQPWRYSLLTAEFDIPIMRDSVSSKHMRDSIDAAFVPFVVRDSRISSRSIDRFAKIIEHHVGKAEAATLTKSLAEAYKKGIVSPELYDRIHSFQHPKLRMSDDTEDQNAVVLIDAGAMLMPSMAYKAVDSAYTARHSSPGNEVTLSADIAKALSASLIPNIVIDSLADSKFRAQEYLNVNSALGVIKKGQRIVDRGDIVNDQIYTNLNNYLDMLEKNQSKEISKKFYLAAQALYILMMFSLLYLFLAFFRKKIYSSVKKVTFIVTIITFFSVLAIESAEMFTNGLYLIPFAGVPLIIAVFTDSRTAIFAHVICILLTALAAPFQFRFVVIELVVGISATFSIYHLTRRSQLLRTAIITFALYIICYSMMLLLSEGSLSSFSWRIASIFGINSVFLSFAYLLILVVEKVFGFTSTVTLVELSDINNPILRHLAEVAPGTFQHSMQVSTLASEAARAIDADTTLVRTGALYHDIGKSVSPVFFTENQHGVNPHAGLDPATSARKIISHVKEGLAIASKEKLPQVIKNFILEHHGKGVTKYFYNTAVNESPDGNVNRDEYQYPGPNPQSKETTILMMADAVEAASRSLKDYSPKSINALVDRIIDSQMNDGLYADSPITFKDVNIVKETFKKRLATIYHSRIEYPEIHDRKPETEQQKNESDVN
ncbi:MAG: HDIG domain-containing protein [Muribaculaceae bacterium]|nr:HDIG domain-containing protein [Muribaculaceae bacterium]